MNIGLLLLRVIVGGIFLGHGTQKLFGWFGGYGLEGTGRWLSTLGYRGRPAARLAGLTEAGSGALLLIGFMTPLAAAGIIGVMLNAALVVHRANGFWNDKGGYEFNLALSGAATALAFTGAGRFSLDAALGLNLGGLYWGIMAVALGVFVGLVFVSARDVAATTEEAAEERRAA